MISEAKESGEQENTSAVIVGTEHKNLTKICPLDTTKSIHI